MGRKNGKTALMAGVALYGLLVEGEGAQVYSCAADREQARLLFGDAKRMVELDPELRRACRIFRDVIEARATGSIYRALSSEAYTKEGLSPTLVLYDELHAAPNRELFDVMALAQGTRLDPLMICPTTAGVRTDVTGRDSIAYSLYEYGKRLATGELHDPTFFFAWWEPADAAGSVTDRSSWRAANPGLGDILSEAELAAAAASVPCRTPEPEFRIKRLNQWVSSATAWLPSGAFEACAVARRLEPGERVVLGFDGSFNHDCTALVACTLDGFLEVLGLWERPVGSAAWEVPIAEVDAAVLAACRDYRVAEIAADPYRWAREIQGWAAAGLPAAEFPTSSPARMVPACATFYDAVVNGTLCHSGDPALVRHVANAVVKVDRLGPRIVKEHRGSPRRSISRWRRSPPMPERPTMPRTAPAGARDPGPDAPAGGRGGGAPNGPAAGARRTGLRPALPDAGLLDRDLRAARRPHRRARGTLIAAGRMIARSWLAGFSRQNEQPFGRYCAPLRGSRMSPPITKRQPSQLITTPRWNSASPIFSSFTRRTIELTIAAACARTPTRSRATGTVARLSSPSGLAASSVTWSRAST